MKLPGIITVDPADEELAIKLAEYNNNMPILYTAVNVGASKNVEGFVMDVNEYHHLENVRVAQ